MKITAYRTHKIRIGDNLFKILDKYLPQLGEKNVVIITSKIVAICQGRVVRNDGKVTRFDLAKKEAQYYLPEKYIVYGVHPTITNNVFTASAGIDESNGAGFWVLWPKDPMNEAKKIWGYLRDKNKIKKLGIVITDSKLTPLRRGVTGFGIAWCGFEPLKNYIGKPDIFGHQLKVTKTNIVDSLAASAVTVTGEGNEQTPLALIHDVPFVNFTNRPPTDEEVKEMTIPLEEDIYSALLTSVKWEKGEGKA